MLCWPMLISFPIHQSLQIGIKIGVPLEQIGGGAQESVGEGAPHSFAGFCQLRPSMGSGLQPPWLSTHHERDWKPNICSGSLCVHAWVGTCVYLAGEGGGRPQQRLLYPQPSVRSKQKHTKLTLYIQEHVVLCTLGRWSLTILKPWLGLFNRTLHISGCPDNPSPFLSCY